MPFVRSEFRTFSVKPLALTSCAMQTTAELGGNVLRVRGDARPNHPHITVREWRGEGHMVMMDVFRGAGRREFAGVGLFGLRPVRILPQSGSRIREATRLLTHDSRLHQTGWSVGRRPLLPAGGAARSAERWEVAWQITA